jgi:hypothetical protein
LQRGVFESKNSSNLIFKHEEEKVFDFLEAAIDSKFVSQNSLMNQNYASRAKMKPQNKFAAEIRAV